MSNPDKKRKKFQVFIGDENLKFSKESFDDPILMGRQIIERFGGVPVDEFAVVALLKNGDFEDIRLDEAYDLRDRGIEKVLVFRTDRSFKFKIDDRDLEWPRACISGYLLKKIADLPAKYSLWLDIRGGQDRKILDADLINLDEPGVERFVSTPPKQICIIVNTREKQIEEGSITFTELVNLAFPNSLPTEMTAYTVSFYKGAGACPDGTLIEGETIELKKGMVFNVTETDKS